MHYELIARPAAAYDRDTEAHAKQLKCNATVRDSSPAPSLHSFLSLP